MAIQFGTVDGLVNISEQTIRVFVSAINSFILQGGPAYAKSKNIAYGAAFQRYVEPVYTKQADDFTLNSIDTPVHTQSGNEQSPARITFCRKMGLLEIDEQKGVFNLTPLGNALLNEDINIKEYALILLTKMGVFNDGEYCDNVFYVVSTYFQSNTTISQSLLEQFVKNKYNVSSLEKTRIDIILNAVATAGLITKVAKDIYVISNTGYALIFNDYCERHLQISPALIDNDSGYSSYIGSFDNGIFDILSNDNINIFNTYYPNLQKYMKENNVHNTNSGSNGPLQQIFYGAPGTGKSKTIKDITKDAEKEERVFRTTFHPDSDYSTFVGCYKPSMKSKDRIYSAEELAVKLKEIKNSGVTYPCHKFAAQYWKSLKDLSAEVIKQILSACGFTESMNVEISKGVAIGQEYLNKEEDGKIIYTFTPQAFTNAYVKAWNTTEDVYLIIEEINRGNCAQIFGDLFQLLDRGDDGKSEYPIDADTDLGSYIAKELESSSRNDFPDGVKDGRKLVLPQNLYIWATMNTSDQSLFPIDSAFKRRWDWKYLPIENAEKGWKIKVNGNEYDWYKFLDAINKEVFGLTHSEDKQLGYFFAKAKGGVIDAETLVNKVYFYLWTDVFKDYDYESQKAFKKPNSNDAITFKTFFEDLKEGEKVNEGMAEQVLINMEIEKLNKPQDLFE